jgi:hypothetical protein
MSGGSAEIWRVASGQAPLAGRQRHRPQRRYPGERQVPPLRIRISRHLAALAAIARHVLTGSLEGARRGYRTAWSKLSEQVPPHAIDTALTAYRDEGRRLAAAVRAAELVERTLRREPLWPKTRRRLATGEGLMNLANCLPKSVVRRSGGYLSEDR